MPKRTAKTATASANNHANAVGQIKVKKTSERMTKSGFCTWMNTEDSVDSHTFCKSESCTCSCHPAKVAGEKGKEVDAARGRAGEATDPGLAEKPKRARQAKKGGGK